MEKMIEVEAGKRLNFKASAFSPIIYNRLFPGRDFLRDMDALKKARDKGEGDLMAPYYEQLPTRSLTRGLLRHRGKHRSRRAFWRNTRMSGSGLIHLKLFPYTRYSRKLQNYGEKMNCRFPNKKTGYPHHP